MRTIGGAGTVPEDGDRLAQLEEENRALRAELARARATASDGTFHAIADSIDQMIWSTRPDGFHDYYNRRWYEFTGVADGITDGEAWNGMFHPEDRDRAWEAWRRSLETGDPYEIEYRLRHKSGDYRWVLGRAQPVRGADGAIARWYGTCTDIHDFKLAEEAVRASEKQMRLIADSLPVLISVVDAGGRYRFNNRAYEQWFGRPREEMAGKHLRDLLGEKAWKVFSPRVAAALGGERVSFDARIPYRNGGARHVQVEYVPFREGEGAAAGFYSLVQDIDDRKRAERALRESEARFRSMADSAPAPVWVTSEAGIEFVNRAFEEFFGMSGEEVLGNVWTELIHPEDLPAVAERREAAWAAREPYVFEARFRAADGEWHWMRPSSRPRFGEDGSFLGYVGIAVDMTEYRRSEAELKESERRFRELADNISQFAWSADATGYIHWYNRRWYDFTGTTLDEMEGWGWTGVHHPDHVERVKRSFAEAIAKGEPWEDTFPLRSAGGEYRWFLSRARPIRDEEGQIVRWFGTNTDVTDLRTAEGALREETRSLETLNRIGAELAGELDVDKIVQMVTDAGVELSGAQFGAFFYNKIDASGDSYMLYTLSGVERSAFDKFPMPRRTAIFAPTFDGEGVVRSDDITRDPRYGKSDTHFGMPKEHLPVTSYLAVPVFSRSGEVIGGLFFGHPDVARFNERHERLLVGIAGQAAVAIDNARLFESAQRELNERRRVEAALRELNQSLEGRVAAAITERKQAEEALRQAQKMEAVGQLTGGIAHDFNNLLTIIIGNLDAARRHLGDTAEGRVGRALANAAVGADRATTLTQRLLAFSRRQPLDPKPIDPNRLVTGMSDLLHRTIGETIEIETVLAAGLWKLEVDPHQLESAIVNLAVNARDAMPDGGKLTIETANTHLDRAYVAHNAEVVPGQYVAICVSDTGTGMDEETVSRAFEPFFTTKEVGKGTGLGLSMVYGFVKQSGGHLKIYSEPGEGTTVKIYLPRLLREAEEEEDAPESIVPEGSREETILVCEDDDDVRAYTVEVLRELGYRVLEAHDGPSALRLLERQEGRVDLLFTDVVLPAGMTGAVLAGLARELRPELKVLFTTGYARNAIVHHGRLDPGVELITKPFAYADLAARVREMLDRPD